MTKTRKTWSAIGVALLAGTGAADATSWKLNLPTDNTALILADGEGGEGGGEMPSSYAISSADPKLHAYDGSAVVKAYADHVRNSYQRAKAAATDLQTAIEALLADPSADRLKAARAAWVAARPAYLQTETFRFYDGPIEAIEGEINAWPMNEAFIDYVEGKPNAGLINDPKVALDQQTLTGLNQKSDEADVTVGWHAIEFLLWGQDKSLDGPGNRPHTDFIPGIGNNDRRRAYLTFVTSQLVEKLDTLALAWSPETKDSYVQKFLALEQREALGRIVNGMAILAGFEFMSERMGVALDSGDQEDEHSCFSDTTKQDFVHNLEGIRRVWLETGLDKLVAERDPATATAVTSALANSEAAVAALGDPWDKVLAAPKDSQPRKDAEAAMQNLQTLADALKVAGNKLGVLVLIPTG